MYFDENDILEMQRRDREDEERAQVLKAYRDAALLEAEYQRVQRELEDAGRRVERTPQGTLHVFARVGPCPCACNSGGWCGGCGHGGCGGRR